MKEVERLAFDRAAVSVRSVDADGRLHVEVTPISKANVCGYLGREIPGAEELGLAADRLYRLYRHPDELAAAVRSFNNVPLLDKHLQVSASAPQKDAVVGSTGTDASFKPPFLTNSLVVWDAAAIVAIQSGEAKELSSAYRYRPDMTPGTADGEPYDGVMRDIVANHVALVPKGRAGPDVVVGDAALFEPPVSTTNKERRPMAKKVLSPKAAKARDTLARSLRPRIAQDAELEEVIKLIEALEGDPESKDDEAEVTGDDDAESQVRALCAGKLSDEDIVKLIAMLKPTTAADEEGEGKKDEKPGDKKDDKKDGETVTKSAMDAAIAAAVKAAEGNVVSRLKGARDAERTVEPWVGKLHGAMDSADAVFEAALKTLGVDTKGVHPSAFHAILKAYPLPGARNAGTTIAADAAASSNDFGTLFPRAAVRHV